MGLHNNYQSFSTGLHLRTGCDRGIAYQIVAWRQMRWIRYFETELRNRYEPPHLTRCPIHYCIGQEGVPAYIKQLKKPGDYLFCNHRNHGYYLSWMGECLSLLMELMGKEDAPNKGRAGSQEISHHAMNFYSGAILSTSIGIAAGVAGTMEDGIVFCCFGDGAADEGIFWEAMNLIALKELPMVLICENNGYATFSPQHKRQARSITERVRSFGVAVSRIQPTAPGRLGTQLQECVNFVRENRKPVFVEHVTYRHCGHVGAHDDDDQGYRSENERALWQTNDDLTILETELLRQGAIEPQTKVDATKFDAELFNVSWAAAANAKDAQPIDYSQATISRGVRSDIPEASEQSQVEFREAILNPY